jgi:hypothetical protein
MAGHHVGLRITEAEFIDRIMAGLLRYLDTNRHLGLADVAELSGYSVVSLKQFRCGAFRSLRMATTLAESIPELADDMRAPGCGCLPSITYDYPPPPRASRRRLPSSE